MGRPATSMLPLTATGTPHSGRPSGPSRSSVGGPAPAGRPGGRGRSTPRPGRRPGGRRRPRPPPSATTVPPTAPPAAPRATPARRRDHPPGVTPTSGCPAVTSWPGSAAQPGTVPATSVYTVDLRLHRLEHRAPGRPPPPPSPGSRRRSPTLPRTGPPPARRPARARPPGSSAASGSSPAAARSAARSQLAAVVPPLPLGRERRLLALPERRDRVRVGGQEPVVVGDVEHRVDHRGPSPRPATMSARRSSSSSAPTGWNRIWSKHRSSHGRSAVVCRNGRCRLHTGTVRPTSW